MLVAVASFAYQKQWASLIATFVWLIGYPILLLQAPFQAIEPEALRFWIALPLALLFPIWLTSRFLVYQWARAPEGRWNAMKNEMRLRKERRSKGVVLFVFGVVMWALVALHPDLLVLGSWLSAPVIGLTWYPLLAGVYWGLLGKRHA